MVVGELVVVGGGGLLGCAEELPHTVELLLHIFHHLEIHPYSLNLQPQELIWCELLVDICLEIEI